MKRYFISGVMTGLGVGIIIGAILTMTHRPIYDITGNLVDYDYLNSLNKYLLYMAVTMFTVMLIVSLARLILGGRKDGKARKRVIYRQGISKQRGGKY